MYLNKVKAGDMSQGGNEPRPSRHGEMELVGYIVDCWVCQAHVDNYLRIGGDPFCSRCGRHLPTVIREQRQRRQKTARYYEEVHAMLHHGRGRLP